MGIKLSGRNIGKIVRAAAARAGAEVTYCFSDKKNGKRYVSWQFVGQDRSKVGDVASLVNEVLAKDGVAGKVRATDGASGPRGANCYGAGMYGYVRATVEE